MLSRCFFETCLIIEIDWRNDELCLKCDHNIYIAYLHEQTINIWNTYRLSSMMRTGLLSKCTISLFAVYAISQREALRDKPRVVFRPEMSDILRFVVSASIFLTRACLFTVLPVAADCLLRWNMILIMKYARERPETCECLFYLLRRFDTNF